MAGPVGHQVSRIRPWLALAGVVAAAAVLLPPGGTAALRDVWVQALQFAVLAVAAPALIVLGAPWRLGRRSAGRAGAGQASAGPASGGLASPDQASAGRADTSKAGPASGLPLADRLARARSHRGGAARGWLVLVGFLAISMAWRLPVAVNAMVRHPVLVAAEAVTLLVAGCALWLELVESPPMLPRASKPQRALSAALPMWAIWASAYVMGFSRTAWFTGLAHAPGHGLSTLADQQIAAGVLWAIPAVCFVPVVYFSMITWLRDSADPDQELREADSGRAGPSMPRPPRGWRLNH
ncbi:MAG TPA: cytochrome c oxidase assembly protein [Streptosporangiaceae bacterium]|nr:cytochrome c oxidase assembly protein [Streptosporangiaceae bacterium]